MVQAHQAQVAEELEHRGRTSTSTGTGTSGNAGALRAYLSSHGRSRKDVKIAMNTPFDPALFETDTWVAVTKMDSDLPERRFAVVGKIPADQRQLMPGEPGFAIPRAKYRLCGARFDLDRKRARMATRLRTDVLGALDTLAVVRNFSVFQRKRVTPPPASPPLRPKRFKTEQEVEDATGMEHDPSREVDQAVGTRGAE